MALLDVMLSADIIAVADVNTPRTFYHRLSSEAVPVSDLLATSLIDSIFIKNARALDPETIRIDFDQPVDINDALLDPDSYEIVALSVGAAELIVQSVETPVGFIFPTFVELHVTEMTDGAIYTAKLVGPITGPDGSTAIGNVESFAGEGAIPVVESVAAKDANTVEVIFSEPMLDNAAIRDPNNYSFDNGLSVASVESLATQKVVLKTTDQTPGILYTLTVRGLLSARINDEIIPQDQVIPSGPFATSSNDTAAIGDSLTVQLLT
jgi:hypothetical protein